MSSTVTSLYKFHGDKAKADSSKSNVDDAPENYEMDRGDEKNNLNTSKGGKLKKPSNFKKTLKKMCEPIKSRFERAKVLFLSNPSNTWKENSLGLLKLPRKEPKYIICLGFCCPCILHGINASDVMTNPEGKFEKDPKTGKWIGARFVLSQAAICCGGLCLTACAAGGAVREQIFEQSILAGKEDGRSVRSKIFFLKQMQMFCLPYCCCPCLAVLQDRRALLKNRELLEITRKEIANSAFAMEEVTLPPDNNDDETQEKENEDENAGNKETK